MSLKEMHFQCKDTNRLKVKTYHATTKQKKAAMPLLVYQSRFQGREYHQRHRGVS